jgi:predicted small metal-binding protein
MSNIKGKCKYCNYRTEANSFVELGKKICAHKRILHPEVRSMVDRVGKGIANAFLKKVSN